MTPRRIRELRADGYIFFSNDRIHLTEKGLQVLSACADHPIPPTRFDRQKEAKQTKAISHAKKTYQTPDQ